MDATESVASQFLQRLSTPLYRHQMKQRWIAPKWNVKVLLRTWKGYHLCQCRALYRYGGNRDILYALQFFCHCPDRYKTMGPPGLVLTMLNIAYDDEYSTLHNTVLHFWKYYRIITEPTTLCVSGWRTSISSPSLSFSSFMLCWLPRPKLPDCLTMGVISMEQVMKNLGWNNTSDEARLGAKANGFSWLCLSENLDKWKRDCLKTPTHHIGQK